MYTHSSDDAPTKRMTRGEATRQLLIEAAVEVLKEVGFAGASARVIAERAGVNQALVFYHFASVTGLLLAALDWVSAQRQARYGALVANADSPQALVEAASSIFREDLDEGYAAVLVAMIAGAATTPGLGREVARRIEPWTGFANDAVTQTLGNSPFASLIPSDTVGFAIVSLYLGMELLTHLDGNRDPAIELFDHALRLSSLLSNLAGDASSNTKATDQ